MLGTVVKALVFKIVALIALSGLVLASKIFINRYLNMIEVKNKSSEEGKHICIYDYVITSDETIERSHQKRNQFIELKSLLHFANDSYAFCGNESQRSSPVARDEMRDTFVLINYSPGCDVNEQINHFSNRSISGLLLAIGCDVDINKDINISRKTLSDNEFIVSLISALNVDPIRHSSNGTQLKVFAISADRKHSYDSVIVIWFLATGAVALGAVWSGGVWRRLIEHNKQLGAEHKQKSRSSTSLSDSVEEMMTGPARAKWTPTLAFVYVLIASLIIVLLYFFLQFLIYVLILVFIITVVTAVYKCLKALCLCLCGTQWSSIVCDQKYIGKVFLHQILFSSVAVVAAIVWFVCRKQAFFWIIHNILALMVCLYLLKAIRLTSYKICLLLLSLFFIYDIFFVFITPLLTSKGNSVMIDVAQSGGTDRCGRYTEQIPIVLRIPRRVFTVKNTTDPVDMCINTESLLGLGDIILPGLLVCYCYAFDMIFNVKYRIYYITTCAGYGLGLVAAFVGSHLMQKGQPALLYLVPFTAVPPVLIAVYRKELRNLWKGPEAVLTGMTETGGTGKTTSSSDESVQVLKRPSDEEDERQEPEQEKQPELINSS